MVREDRLFSDHLPGQTGGPGTAGTMYTLHGMLIKPYIVEWTYTLQVLQLSLVHSWVLVEQLH